MAGVTMHVIQRGNNRSPCFFNAADYRIYLEQLEALSARFECLVHAYVLMTTHVHLLLTPLAVNSASMLMKHLGQRYVQHVNRSYLRTGTLWDGRFKSCLAQSENYVLTCYRYIELNPVRAAMVAHPAAYHWSSYGANAVGTRSSLVAMHEEYRRLGDSPAARQEAYRALFDSYIDPAVIAAIREATRGNVALGERSFQSHIETAVGRRAHRGTAGRPKRRTECGT